MRCALSATLWVGSRHGGPMQGRVMDGIASSSTEGLANREAGR